MHSKHFIEPLTVAEFAHLIREKPERMKKFVWTTGPYMEFMLDPDDLSLLDIGLSPTPFIPDHMDEIRLAHPMTMKNIERWQEVFGDFEILQPFPQLDRPIIESIDMFAYAGGRPGFMYGFMKRNNFDVSNSNFFSKNRKVNFTQIHTGGRMRLYESHHKKNHMLFSWEMQTIQDPLKFSEFAFTINDLYERTTKKSLLK